MSSDRIKEKLERFILGLLSPVDFYAPYACKVVSQNSDGTLELRPEDDRLADYSKVPVHYGIPDAKATFAAGARVMLEFENGSRNAPYVSSFDFSSLTLLELGARDGTTQLVALENLVKSELGKLHDCVRDGFNNLSTTTTALISHTHTFVGTGVVQISPQLASLQSPAGPSDVGDVACVTLKVR